MVGGADRRTYLGFRGNSLNHAITCIAGCGFLLFGYDQGVMGTLLTLPNFIEQFPKLNTDTLHNSIVQGTCISIYEIGCMMGALTTIWSGDKFGRRKNIFFGSIIMTIGAILQCTSFELPQLIVGRIVTGIGNGFITSTVPMWQSECAKPEVRGQLVIVSGALITGGIMVSYWVDYGFSFAEGSVNWRFPIAFQIVFAIVIMSLVLRLPESPRWLVRKERVPEAKAVFAALANVEPEDQQIQQQIDEVKATLIEEEMSQAPIKKIFTQGPERHFHRTNLAFWNQCFQQISGINLITYYLSVVLKDSVGLDANLSRLIAACNGTEYFIASWIAFWTIEKFGRRSLMLFGAAGQAISMAILSATVWSSENQDNFASSIVAVVFFFIFNTFFAIGWLGMTWLYPAEIVALEIRAPANGISTSSNWIFNFLVVMITPIAFHNIKHHTYTIFAIMNALIVVATYFFFPETAGRSLEEIDEIFATSNPKTPWDVVGIANRLPKLGHMDEETLRARNIRRFEEKAVHSEAEKQVNTSSSSSEAVNNSNNA